MPRIVAVATASSASAARARRELGDLADTTSFEHLLDNPSVALVDCCAPTGDHARMATATLLAGRALFCEKPLTASLEDSERIVALAQGRSLAGGINFHFRWIPAILEARRLIEAGLLGDVLGFHMRYYRSSNLRRDRPATWRFTGAGSGVLVDLGAHLIDMTLHLLGPIAAVAARTRTLVEQRPDQHGQMIPITSDDVAWLQIELAGGGRGTLEVSKLVPGAADDLRIEAYGTQGTLVFDTRDPNSLAVAEGAGAMPGGRSIATFSRTVPSAALPSAETPTATLQWHLASMAAFVRALGDGLAPQPDLKAGLAVDRVLVAAAQSAARAGELVQISPVKE
ncbi:MAG: Gfo/Idh/MocA family oxidoreductase, partial [Roseiflexaceae bacterium]